MCTVVKSKVEISQNFVAFSEHMKFNELDTSWSFKTPSKALANCGLISREIVVKEGLEMDMSQF